MQSTDLTCPTAALRRRYADNCAALAAYPYCFRTDFPDFDALPLHSAPCGGAEGVPGCPAENGCGTSAGSLRPVIDRYFFRDLTLPVLARDVYSQYQLEYLNDTVRPSAWVGRENHIYLHYTDWAAFCAHLPYLDFRALLKEEKFVILIEGEIDAYPIDFKTRFGIDYSQCPVRPVGVREVNRLIWHTQLSTHNGGDFFNEIFYGHPNLIAFESLMFHNTVKAIAQFREKLRGNAVTNTDLLRQLAGIDSPTDKDILVAMFLSRPEMSGWLDPAARIAPAFFYQPHFEDIHYRLAVTEDGGGCICFSPEYEEIRQSPILLGFRYIKAFSPIRRPTTSYAATVRYMLPQIGDRQAPRRIPDVLLQRVLNRSYLRDPDDRLLRDGMLVRFEDAKLNPAATFTRLAAFLDIPYTESMTCCSSFRGVNVSSGGDNAVGFDTAPVYRTYDACAGDEELRFLEHFLRDLYGMYGYDLRYDQAGTEEPPGSFTTLDGFIRRSLSSCARILRERGEPVDEAAYVEAQMDAITEHRRQAVAILQKRLPFVSLRGKHLEPIPLLRPDPALLEQPLYH